MAWEKEISLADALHSNAHAEGLNLYLAKFPTLARWYIDSREWEAHGLDLPLLEALRPAEQEAVKRFHFAADRRMSLSSHLLKYLYIHHACGVPWKDIVLSRTPMPENRPIYNSSPNIKIDFNVSHQAGLTTLAGVEAPDHKQYEGQSEAESSPLPRVGIDVTCVNEHRRKKVSTLKEFIDHVSMFTEVFSDAELETMKDPVSTLRRARKLGMANAFSLVGEDEANSKVYSDETIVRYGMRMFYSYWALKEAYLKMTGDALLAPWVRTLEFTDVIPPDPVEPLVAPKPYAIPQSPSDILQSPKNWGAPYSGVTVTKAGEQIIDVRLQLVALESDYIVATAGLGPPVGVVPRFSLNSGKHHLPGLIRVRSGETVEDHPIAISTKKVVGDMDPWNVPFPIIDPWLPFQEVDVNIDIRPCAEGRCIHPEDPSLVLARVSAA
ncbi:4'-phosphopantetheinyl transferase A [Penicillium taxi]|uniref:4'-phosphopantetheinyl transferase A n=1 Tax=Penicillium taxi TaxID=168475 RepID=UPI0025458068|nr:4'-phosphopantetheinyl transferase A [Penicillium taxi]KAJ5888702.1 4'-phosphopantetheinyl transferase A [Penicillium taxi]